MNIVKKIINGIKLSRYTSCDIHKYSAKIVLINGEEYGVGGVHNYTDLSYSEWAKDIIGHDKTVTTDSCTIINTKYIVYIHHVETLTIKDFYFIDRGNSYRSYYSDNFIEEQTRGYMKIINS